MTTRVCCCCGKTCEAQLYKIAMPNVAQFINETYSRYRSRSNSSPFYPYDVLCIWCRVDIIRYLRDHPNLRKAFTYNETHCDIIDCSIITTRSAESIQEEATKIRLSLVFDDGHKCFRVSCPNFYRSDSLESVIRLFKIFETLPVSINDLVLIAIESGIQRRKVCMHHQPLTLHDLSINSGDVLYFQSLNQLPRKIEVVVVGPIPERQIQINFSTTDTINDLLIKSIKRFDLDSYPSECIQLQCESMKFTPDMLKQTFVELNITEYAIFYISINNNIRPSDVDNNTQIVDTDKGNGTSNVDRGSQSNESDKDGNGVDNIENGSRTTKVQIESRTTDINKSSRTANVDDTSLSTNINEGALTITVDKSNCTANSDRKQKSPEPLVITETPSSSPIKKEMRFAFVRCNFPEREILELKVPISITVSELTAKIVAEEKDQSLWQFDLRCNGTDLENDNPEQRLSELGVKPDSWIYACMTRFTPVPRSSSTSIERKPIVGHGVAFTTSVHTRRHGPTGLQNLGNTCFMNSVLQCLSHVIPLRNFFLDSIHDAQTESYFVNPFDSCGAVSGAFSEVIWELWQENSHEFAPTRLKRVIGDRAPRFATFDQQDAQEFMIFLLDALNKELVTSNNLTQETETISGRLFHGAMKTKMTCLECRRERECMNTIVFLPLPLSQQERVFAVSFASIDGYNHDVTYVPVINSGLIKHVVVNFVEQRPLVSIDRIKVVSRGIDNELSFDTPLSIILENELLFVEKEKEDDEWHKTPTSLYPTKFPKDLAHCFEEFVTLEVLDDPWFCHGKCNRSTKVAKQLQLQSLPPVLIIQLKRFAQDKGVRRKLDTHVEFPLDDLDLKQFLPPDTTTDKAIYDLIAVINHIGSIHSGHYTAYIRQQSETHQWYEISDSSVFRAYSSHIVSRNAYLLIYLRRDQKTKT